jgi:hypothetical protein
MAGWAYDAILPHAQGGRFDHADRLFSSVGGAWDNCLANSSDVKELTPGDCCCILLVPHPMCLLWVC